jgi:hypothetical protein
MKISILFLLFGLVACSSDPSKPAPASGQVAQTDDAKKADDAKRGVVCTYERPVGSLLKEKKCTTAAEREAARQQNGLIDMRNAADSGVQ